MSRRLFLLLLCALLVLTASAGRLAAQEPPWKFHRGVNLNGPAVVIDGNRWEADEEAKDFVCRDQRFENQKVSLRPETDDARARMIRSSRWQPAGNNSITLSGLPAGAYRVYLYNWEDTESQRFTVSLDGRAVLSNYDSGRAGTWKKLGPWDVAISDGSLQLTSQGGHANWSGLEIWRRDERPAGGPDSAADAGSRAAGGLLALYTFQAGEGELVRDRSEVAPPLHLRIDKPSGVIWKDGHLIVRSATGIQSAGPAAKIVEAVKRSRQITIEAWIAPQNDRQEGPARIVSLSPDPNRRNFTLGQDGSRFDVRLRTSGTSNNGIPSTAAPAGTAAAKRTHVVYTLDRAGQARIYIDGQQRASKKIPGNFSNWGSFPLVLGNEATGDRPWLGTLYLAAVYGRALTPAEVKQNFHAGPRAGSGGRSDAALAQSRSAILFETKVAPLLVQNCLECHDSVSKKGLLDLSKRAAALAGGESGKAIVPGKSGESLLWELVEADDMPAERDPLTTDEKALLRQWIDAGAAWPLETLDPAIYVHDDKASRNWVRRLTVPEYIETVRSAVGVDIAREARELLPPDLRADGFSNTAYNLNVDLKHVEAYSRLAEIAVGRMDVLKFASRFSKSRSLSTDATMRDFVAAMGKWLLRGPLNDREITNYSGIATTVASAGGNYEDAVRFIIEAMLQSPRFIYRIESQRGDGTAWPVGQFELASRLSYMIWGGPPDEQLLRAAEAGQLHDPSQVKAQVGRMLQDPRAVERSAQFVAQWLHLDRLGNMQPDPQKFPQWDPSLAEDMRRETLEFFKEVVWKEKRPLADLLNAQFTYASPQLARHYGLEPQGSGWQRYDLSSAPDRGGLLTQGSVLTVGGDDASMVTRGLFVLHDLLRGVVKDPPPGVDTTPVPSKPGLSQRMVSEQRIANVACGACHSRFEPLAFGLEKFDGLGALHEKDEHGNKLRDDGEILFPGTAEPVKFRSSAELMKLLAESERVSETITWKVTQFALGRPLVAADARTVEKIHQAAQQGGGTYAALMTAIATSDLVMTTRTERQE